MALSYKTRRRLSLLILLLGLPAYIGAVWFVTSLFDRPSIVVELLIYIVLGILWALPFRAVFRGVGKADPDAPPSSEDR
ncbi:DUF2842 domain-containing protein [Rhodophyticola sp. CCM32]|uniref:DUF2842 domain-containing protein n=1 Tax=Rhodophyticola sp. CCM32 TaxID=2916397 RepID=UPI00107EEAC8|nr:DUF2842 domain-containing protein [Rhodophyticola sp. CCM32]QBX99596.1 DUF2842 domain-containing protein [Rhodophyticola sp. CCM32]